MGLPHLRPTHPAANRRGFSLAWEKIEALRADGLDDLLVQDWQEIEADAERVPFRPDWERARLLERHGNLFCLAARNEAREIVGYNAFHVMTRIHAVGSVQATNDVIWALKEWRGRVGLALIVEAERFLTEKGVDRITYSCKTHLNLLHGAHGGRLGSLLSRLGYRQIEAVYEKVI